MGLVSPYHPQTSNNAGGLIIRKRSGTSHAQKTNKNSGQ